MAGQFRTATGKLEKAMHKVPQGTAAEKAFYYRDHVVPAMEALRELGDRLEVMLGEDFWPMPTYAELLFGIKS